MMFGMSGISFDALIVKSPLPSVLLVTCDVIVNLESVKSTPATFKSPKGTKSLPEPLTRGAPKNIVTVSSLGKPPSNKPVTVPTPVIDIEDPSFATDTTLL